MDEFSSFRKKNTFIEEGMEIPNKEHGIGMSETETKEGDWYPQRLVVIRFPDKDHAESFLADPEYQPVVEEVRDRMARLAAEG